jgi:hypothetical protein
MSGILLSSLSFSFSKVFFGKKRIKVLNLMSFAERTKSYRPAFGRFFRESQFSSSTVNVLDCSDFKIS